jgi:hypothetical protein
VLVQVNSGAAKQKFVKSEQETFSIIDPLSTSGLVGTRGVPLKDPKCDAGVRNKVNGYKKVVACRLNNLYGHFLHPTV